MKTPRGRGLLLSAYDAYSHRQWHNAVTAMFPDIEWTRLTLPPRYFRWRIRGNSLSWAFKHRRQLTDNHDFLLCTSMTDLSALRGFVPELTRLPTAVYFHENQFQYPERRQQVRSVEPLILNLYTALCADELVFNSHYNHDSFIDGVTTLLRKLPDEVPPGLLDRLSRVSIIPVPLPDPLYRRGAEKQSPPATDRPLTLVWNHRWEYDKGPERLLALVQRLIDAGLRFRLHLVGQQFRQHPPAFARLTGLLETHYRLHDLSPGHCGFIEDREEYLDLLRASDIVLSTADHDFQGLSLLEGAICGCTPLAPARLVYPEYLSSDCLYGGDADVDAEAAHGAERILEWDRQRRLGHPLPDPRLPDFSRGHLRPRYADLLQRLSDKAGIR
ncbi:MAG: tRNA-queuosine alpha-mannosyltransferase domain-containing protein [Pseudomonadota bacterium]